MLALGRAMMSEPRLLCLDEPSLGLAPMIVQEIFRTIRAINGRGTSVLLVEQNARYALETASRGYVLQTGRILTGGPCAALKQDERVKEAYLGRKGEANADYDSDRRRELHDRRGSAGRRRLHRPLAPGQTGVASSVGTEPVSAMATISRNSATPSVTSTDAWYRPTLKRRLAPSRSVWNRL